MADPEYIMRNDIQNFGSLSELIDQIVEKRLSEQIAHNCFTCRWFQFEKDVKPANRHCVYPRPIRWNRDYKAGECQKWELQPDRTKRVNFVCYGTKK